MLNNNLNLFQKECIDIFNNCYNFGFGTPKSDTCAHCDLLTNEDHKHQASKAFEVQKEDKRYAELTDNAFFITFDVQKTMPLPKLSTKSGSITWVFT